MEVVTRYLELTRANLRHGHVYLGKHLDFFPQHVLGGANKSKAAPRKIEVQWNSEVVHTDIDREKRIFRQRGWLRRFFAANNLAPGDRVVLERLGPYSYRVSAEPLELTCLSIQQ